MKKLLVFCFASVVLFLVAPTGFAQNVEPSPATIKLKHKSRISVTYDKFKDETTVKVGPYFLSSGMDLVMTNSTFELMAAFTFTGKKMNTPVDHATVAFISSSRDWKFLNDGTLYALVDGERLSLGTAERDSDVKLGSVKEFLAVTIPYEAFSKIANGKTVEMKLGSKEFKLKDEHLEGFRDLASRMVPQ